MIVHRLSPAFPESLKKDSGFVIVALIAVGRPEMELIAAVCPQRPLDVARHFITPLVNIKLQQLAQEHKQAAAAKPVEYMGPRNLEEPEGTDPSETG